MSLTAEQNDLILRFTEVYNEIDAFIKSELDEDRNIGFMQAVRRYGDQGRLLNKDVQALAGLAELRNVIVHERRPPYTFMAVPLPEAITMLEEIRDRIIRPERVDLRFNGEVSGLDARESLLSVLALIHERDYSQFPVYDKGAFAGLLTENGITRWLAFHTSTLDTIDAGEVSVADVLAVQEKRTNYAFVPRTMTVMAASELFRQNLDLEAAIVTHSGKETEAALGIITRSDIIESGY